MTKTRYFLGLPHALINIASQEIECVIDTGFDGSLMLPETTIQRFQLKKITTIECVLADGTVSKRDLFEGDAIWLGQKRTLRIVSMNTNFALIGMKLLNEARTTMHPARNILTIESA